MSLRLAFLLALVVDSRSSAPTAFAPTRPPRRAARSRAGRASAPPPGAPGSPRSSTSCFPPFCAVCRGAAGRRPPGPAVRRRAGAASTRLAPPWCHVCGLALGRFADRPSAPAHRVEAAQAALRPVPEPAARVHAMRARPPATEVSCARPCTSFKFGGRARARRAARRSHHRDGAVGACPSRRPTCSSPFRFIPRRERASAGFNQALLLARRLGRGWERAGPGATC